MEGGEKEGKAVKAEEEHMDVDGERSKLKDEKAMEVAKLPSISRHFQPRIPRSSRRFASSCSDRAEVELCRAG